ncbi:hypothetical protein KI387_040963, partial [Taxus chinensis]
RVESKSIGSWVADGEWSSRGNDISTRSLIGGGDDECSSVGGGDEQASLVSWIGTTSDRFLGGEAK